ncbi:MAG TPA: endolytic transglycosylase MltG, partial [Bryobacteraceae bacterium]|nr:endolytic transglycosylase MltG [Bryobacteraceae bacterium]
MKLRHLVTLLFLLLAGAAAYVGVMLRSPYAGFEDQVFVDFPKGTTTMRMAEMLVDAGVIRNKWEFLLVRTLERRRTLQAGEYLFREPADPFRVFDRIARGDIYYVELVVPEGRNMFDIAELAASLGLFPAERFLRAARDPSAIRDVDPKAPTLEGYLFPDTYR